MLNKGVSVVVVHVERLSCVQGYGKRVATDEFMLQRRGGKGNIAIKLRDGDTLVDFHPVSGNPNGT
jgi:DNA gyrase/topoisomerase IV subunit A